MAERFLEVRLLKERKSERARQFPGSERSSVLLEHCDSPGVGKWKGEFQARRMSDKAGGGKQA